MKLTLSLLITLVAAPPGAVPVPVAVPVAVPMPVPVPDRRPMQLIVESPDGRTSQTPYATEQACERARKQALRDFLRGVAERQRRARPGAGTRIVIAPVCLPI